MLAWLQSYDPQNVETVWELLRSFLGGEPVPGWRFNAPSANALMLVSALLFIFMLELLLTIGIQVWERRLLGRMQRRWGPQEAGGVTPKNFRRVLIPILVLLAIPAVLYGLEYWSAKQYDWYGTTIATTSVFLGGNWLIMVAAAILRWRKGRLSLAFQVFGLSYAAISLAATIVSIAAMRLGPVSFDALTGITAFVPLVTTLSTIAAFLIYIVYTIGWAWRQGIYDAIKVFFKEDVVPLNADRFLFLFAPIMVYVPALLSWVVIPFGVFVINGRYAYAVAQDLNAGMLLIIADFAMFLVAVIMSGYGSNNKYALVGAMREAALLLTYEIPMLMALLCVALFAGSLNLVTIVQAQSMTWGILPLFPAFVIYLIAALAETNRPPFDLAEASNELLGGYLVEYSGVRFALFYIAEYANIFTAGALMAVCFFGGWKGPMFLGFEGLWLTSVFWMLLKTYACVYFFIWARATMPRIRIDQIMFFSWKFLLPVSIVVCGVTAIGVAMRHPWFSANRLWNASEFRYDLLSTSQALGVMTAHEKAFFWCYNALLLAIGIFIAVLAWRILRGRRSHPLPRRAISWAE
jgi:NADH-quinone oxidoreductase subunit H